MKPSPDRVPPGQRLVTDFPVLHAGSILMLDKHTWRLEIGGLVERPLTIDWNTLVAYPSVVQISDIHCVTGWSKLDTRWKGVRVDTIIEEAAPLPQAQHAVAGSPNGWTTNLPLPHLLADDVLVAYEYDGRPLSPEHGGPVRLLVPKLYFWKSAKWLSRIELTATQRLGFWETRGYHALGDPWLEQRYSGD